MVPAVAGRRSWAVSLVRGAAQQEDGGAREGRGEPLGVVGGDGHRLGVVPGAGGRVQPSDGEPPGGEPDGERPGLDGGVRFSTANPKAVEVFGVVDLPGIGREQTWQRVDASSQSAWPTVTGPIFETGFSDSILQMWASFLAEREGLLGERFGCATPEEARTAHGVAAAAGRSHELRTVVDL